MCVICRGVITGCPDCDVPDRRDAILAELSVALEWALRRVPDHYKRTPAYAECEAALADRSKRIMGPFLLVVLFGKF